MMEMCKCILRVNGVCKDTLDVDIKLVNEYLGYNIAVDSWLFNDDNAEENLPYGPNFNNFKEFLAKKEILKDLKKEVEK